MQLFFLLSILAAAAMALAGTDSLTTTSTFTITLTTINNSTKEATAVNRETHTAKQPEKFYGEMDEESSVSSAAESGYAYGAKITPTSSASAIITQNASIPSDIALDVSFPKKCCQVKSGPSSVKGELLISNNATLTNGSTLTLGKGDANKANFNIALLAVMAAYLI